MSEVITNSSSEVFIIHNNTAVENIHKVVSLFLGVDSKKLFNIYYDITSIIKGEDFYYYDFDFLLDPGDSYSINNPESMLKLKEDFENSGESTISLYLEKKIRKENNEVTESLLNDAYMKNIGLFGEFLGYGLRDELIIELLDDKFKEEVSGPIKAIEQLEKIFDTAIIYD